MKMMEMGDGKGVAAEVYRVIWDAIDECEAKIDGLNKGDATRIIMATEPISTWLALAELAESKPELRLVVVDTSDLPVIRKNIDWEYATHYRRIVAKIGGGA